MGCFFTDDSVMSIDICETPMNSTRDMSDFSASTVERYLKKLATDGYITKYGADKNTFYAKI